MTVTRLLPAPVVPPPGTEAGNECASTTAVVRTASSPQDLARSDSGRPDDNYVWSVAAGEDGSYLFYAVSRSTTGWGQTSFRQPSSESAAAPETAAGSAGAAGSVWSFPDESDVAAQYAFYSSLTACGEGRLLDVYA